MKAKDFEPGLYWDIDGHNGPTVVEVRIWGDGDIRIIGIGDELGYTIKADIEITHLRKLEIPTVEYLVGLPE